MNHHNNRLHVRLDGYSRVCLTVLAVLLTVLILGLWAEKPALEEPASGAAKGFVNAAEQRQQMIRLQAETNEKLDKLLTLLASGKLEVQVQDSTEASDKGAADADKPAEKK